MFVSILELKHYKLFNALGLIFVTPSLYEWKVFPMPKALISYKIDLGSLTNGTTSLKCHFEVSLVLMMLQTLLKERNVTFNLPLQFFLSNKRYLCFCLNP